MIELKSSNDEDNTNTYEITQSGISFLIQMHKEDGAPEYVRKIENGGIGCYIATFENGKTARVWLPRQDRHIVLKLAKAGLIDGVAISKYEAAIEVKEKLEAAKKEYLAAMTALGAEKQEDGDYEDYYSWLEIPGVPCSWEDCRAFW